MRLHENWRPTSLDDVVGQSCVARLKHFVTHPRSDALLFVGGSGGGKTSAAEAIASTLGTEEFPGSIYRSNGTKFCLEIAERYFEPATTPFRYKTGQHWHVLIIDEVEWLHEQTVNYLKDALEQTIRDPVRKVIVIATSNDVGGFVKRRQTAFLDRFKRYNFETSIEFAAACFKRLAQVCAIEGISPPDYSAAFDDDGSFSMRRALDIVENTKQEQAEVNA